MSNVKSKLRQAVTSSTIRRASLDESFIHQSNDTPTYAPFDEPEKRLPIKSSENECIDLKYLSKTELKVLKAIYLMLLDKKNMTSPVYLQKLSDDLGNPISTLKKTIQKLEKKKIILRVEFKPGRGGWTCYTVADHARDKLEAN